MNYDNHCPQRLLLSRKEAAEYLGISIRSVDYLISQRQLATRRIGGRRLIPYTSLSQYSRRDHPGPIAPHHPRKVPVGAGDGSSAPEQDQTAPCEGVLSDQDADRSVHGEDY